MSKNHEPRDFGCSSIRLLAPIGYYYEPKHNSERGGTESMESSQGRKRVYHEGRTTASPVLLKLVHMAVRHELFLQAAVMRRRGCGGREVSGTCGVRARVQVGGRKRSCGATCAAWMSDLG
jgi:hypothetical protein